jgi:predicted SprT family Zn-dependent metalloprotease
MTSPDPEPRSAETKRQLQENAKKISEASVEAARQHAIVWEARLNMAIAADDSRAMQRALEDVTSLSYMDYNCSCGTGGGTAYFG